MPSPLLMGAVRKHPIWRDASEQTLRALCTNAEDRHLAPGEDILTAGHLADRIHLLLDGAVRVFYPATDEHAEVTVKLFWAPAAFGDAESIMRVRWAETVQTLTAVRVVVIPAQFYFRLMQADASVCFRQYWDVSRRFAVAIRSERAANFSELRDRVIALFVTYANHFGQPDENGTLIDFRLSQEMMAKQVSSNRRSIVRVLSDLYKTELVSRKGRRFVVKNVNQLLAASSSAAPDLSFKTEDRPWAEVKKPD